MFKKLALSLLIFLIAFTSIAPSFLLVNAQSQSMPVNPPGNASSQQTAPPEGTWYNQSFDQWYNKVYDESISPSNEIFGERYTAAQVQWVIYSIFAFFLNSSLGNTSASQDAVACFITNSGNIEACRDSIEGLLGSTQEGTSYVPPQSDKNLFQLVFADRPFSGIGYVKEKLHKFNLVPEVHAQTAGPGFGFDALAPVQDMWRASRNIAFGLFVLVAIVFSFMIMFRVKISPQVVISVQSAIPKLITALVLVTFSYAIAGFLIDLMYVVIGILSAALSQMSPGGLTTTQAFAMLTGVGSGGTQAGTAGLIGTGLVYLFLLSLCLLVLLFQSISFSSIAIIFPPAAGTILVIGLLLMIVVMIIAIIVAMWMMIKAWWMLFKAFANILLLTIFAPLQIVFGSVASGVGFGSWLKSFISNLAVFVSVGTMLVLATIFLAQAWTYTGFGTISFFAEIFYLKAYRLGEAQAGKDRGPDATLLEVEGVGSSFSRMAVDERNNPLIVVDNAGGSPRDQYYDRMQATRNAVNRIFVVDPRGVDFTKMSPNGYGLYISARIPQMLKVKELLLKDDWSPKDVSLDAIRSWLSPFDFVDRNELLHLRYWLVTGIIDSAFRTRGRTIELGWSRNSLNTFRRNITSDLGAGGERVVRFISVDDLNRLLKWSNAELKALNASGARAAGFGGGKDGGR